MRGPFRRLAASVRQRARRTARAFAALGRRFRAASGQTKLAVVCGGIVLLAFAGAGAYTLAQHGIPSVGGSSPLDKDAQQIIDTCAKDSYPPACYDKEIPKLMDHGLTMEQAFQVTSIIQDHVSDYYYCHVLGHELASKETAKDPTKWTQVIARCPVGQCSNGCLHGAAQERFRNETLTPAQQDEAIPMLKTICTDTTRNYTGLEQASCFHSLGHLTMYMTGANVDKSVSMCDEIAHVGGTDYTQTCYEGVFMQIFQPLEPEDFGLVRNIPATTTALAETYCDTFSGEPRAACHRESWPLYRQTLGTPAGLTHFCSLVNNDVDITRCYNAMFYVLAAEDNFDTTRIIPLCDGLDEKRKGQCFANSASRFIETDYRLGPKAVALCQEAAQQGVGDRCYTELLFYSTFNYQQGTPAFTAFCDDMPEPWKGECLAGDGKNVTISQE